MIVVVLLAVWMVLVSSLAAQRIVSKRRSRAKSSPPPFQQRPGVRVLRGEDEVNSAFERAIEFERSVVRSAEARIERYAEGRSHPPPISLHPDDASHAEADTTGSDPSHHVLRDTA